MDALVREISDIIAACLSDADVSLADDGSQELRPVFTWDEADVCLWPFMYVKPDGSWHVYSNFTGDKPNFLAFDTSNYRSNPNNESLASSLRLLLKPKRKPQQPLEVFRAEVENDLNAFADVVCAPPQYFDHDHGFGYEWGKSVSEGTELRRDYFRLGPDGPEWQDEQDWVPYRAYLRKLANWPIIASRLRHQLDEIERQFAEEETKQLGWEPDVSTHREAHVLVTEYGGGNPRKKMFSQLIDDIDKDLGVETGQTQVFFVNGEAGIGKTRSMVKAARNRAQEVERNQGSVRGARPLFLYVRSTGRVLDDLDAAVDHAVALTQNLTAKRVKALCRNGLIALLIDGFDELLGGAAYSDAIDSLQDWLNALGGRGVLIVSARSSYYMNQYRSSVQRAGKTGNAAVRHSIAEVQRWTPDEIMSFLSDYGLPASRFERLPDGDRKLLGLPFFARAFAEMCRSGDYEETHANSPSFTDRLLNHYLVREERKLAYTADSGSGLLDREELRRTFEYVTEVMVDSHEREIDSGDLELAAAMALGMSDVEELDDRDGLRERLQVLCGLATDSGTRGPTRFRFQHEVFFDNFLAGVAARHLHEQHVSAFYRLMSRSEWRAATVSGVVAAVDIALLSDALAGFRFTGTHPGAASHDTVAATNLGALWAEVIRTAAEMPGCPIVGATFTEPLDLSDTKVSDAALVDCRLESLTLPAGAGWRLRLDGTSIKKIVAAAGQTTLTGLRGVRHKDLVELLFRPGKYYDRRPDILQALRTCGAEVIDAPEPSSADIPVRVEAARHYLKNLAEYAPSTLILKENHQPDDQRLKWTQAYDGEWKPFIDSLKRAGLGRLENFSAKGYKKIRLRLQFGPTSILDEESEDPQIRSFWATVKG
ncbi:NACHT domain-containing protein [Streptomyces adustus]